MYYVFCALDGDEVSAATVHLLIIQSDLYQRKESIIKLLPHLEGKWKRQ